LRENDYSLGTAGKLKTSMTHTEELEREFAELKQQATAIRRYL
jgi:hypothetical protein